MTTPGAGPGELVEVRSCADAKVPDTMEGLRRQNSAYRSLCRSLEEQVAILTQKGREYHEATTTLESERAANAQLTDELDQAAAEIRRLSGLVERARDVLSRLDPDLEAIVCYASTIDEHEPNRLAYDARATLAEMGE